MLLLFSGSKYIDRYQSGHGAAVFRDNGRLTLFRRIKESR
jgi:hypothetical protein